MKSYFLLFFVFIACTSKKNRGQNNESKNKSPSSQTISVALPIAHDTLNPSTEIIETFTDSLNIGKKGECKIELLKHRVFDDIYVIVKFYTKGPNYWYHQNTFLYECSAMMNFQPDISDFNNDGFNDITFISATAARGANEVRRLFIYDDYKKELVSIVNSQDYPNMSYNKHLDCIDAFMIYGGSSTVFARIEGDSLKEFASVENDNFNRNVYKTDKYGNRKLLRKDTINAEDIYERYINYQPLIKWKE